VPDRPTKSTGALVGGLLDWMPGVGVARRYQRAWFPQDLVAGLVLTALLIPAGMGYAQAAGLPAINGLYATIVPLIAYALLGPSRILVLGPDSSLVPLIAVAIVPLSGGDPDRAVGFAGLLAVLVAVLVAGAGLARLGFVTDLLSVPVRQGYMNGIALIVLVSQLGKLFGFSVSGDNLVLELQSWVQGILDGLTNPVALAIGSVSLAVILVCRRWFKRIPGVLVAVVGATIVSAALDLASTADINVLGVLPRGLPQFTLPPLGIGDISTLLPAAIGIALVSATDMSVLSRTFAGRGGYRVDANRELFALGGSGLAAGLFQGFSVSSSATRTPVAEAAGSKTQLTGVVGALAICALLVLAPGLLAALPESVLGAVVVAAALSLFELDAFVRLWRARKSELLLALASFAGVAFVGVIEGIFFAVVLSLLAFVRRSWRPHDAVLGRATGVKGYHDLTYYPQARQIPGLVLYRFDAPLFFANADVFADRIRDRIDLSDPPARWVVVAAEPMTDIDTTAADVLAELHEELAARGIVLAFAELKDFVRARLIQYGTLERLGELRTFPTIGTAVDAYIHATGQSWVDWEEADRPPDAREGPSPTDDPIAQREPGSASEDGPSAEASGSGDASGSAESTGAGAVEPFVEPSVEPSVEPDASNGPQAP
jgi:high affinity sulfate transporter 1